MAVTLAQASLNAASDIDRMVIDEFRKSSFILDRLPFQQSVNPDGGGATLVYGYTRQITQRAAAFRAINAEYTPTQVTKQQYTVNLRPLGGSFEIDRVLTGIGAVSEVSFQLAQLVKATKAKFANAFINGDVAVDPDGFDGLNVALTDSSTEVAGPVVDFTGVTTQATALAVIQRINAWLYLLDGAPDALLMNGLAKSWFSICAAFSGQLRSAQDAFGRPIETYRDIPLIDVGEKDGVSDLVIPTYGTTSEVQTISVTADSGTFTLTFNGQTTTAMEHDVSTANMVTALNALSNLRSGDVSITGTPGTTYVVTFAQDYAGVNVPMLVATDVDLVGTAHAVTVAQTTKGGTGAGGLTDIYAVRFGLDAVHGVAVPGQLIKTWLPDFTTAGAVKKGEAEMGPVAVALKASKAAGVLRNCKVA
jgi:hypothetical protein